MLLKQEELQHSEERKDDKMRRIKGRKILRMFFRDIKLTPKQKRLIRKRLRLRLRSHKKTPL